MQKNYEILWEKGDAPIESERNSCYNKGEKHRIECAE